VIYWPFTAVAFIALWASTIDAAPDHRDGFDTERGEIGEVLSQQASAWNRGDIDAFMEHYWKSESLTFSAGGQTTRGWQATKDNYRRRYPTRDAMGTLTFAELEIVPIGAEGALVLGKWKLDRASSPVGGNFSLVLRRIDGRWLIVHDHTSRAEAAVPSTHTSQMLPAPAKNQSCVVVDDGLQHRCAWRRGWRNRGIRYK
jgi:ketosteroid isomerase-like protein